MNIQTLASILNRLNESENISIFGSGKWADSTLSADETSLIDTYQPQKALIVYGTLAPGQANHHIVEHINGEWVKATIKGRLENKGWGAEMGFAGFTPAGSVNSSVIDCHVLISDELTANWSLLDKFEGAEYRRIFAQYECLNGDIGVGYIYALNV